MPGSYTEIYVVKHGILRISAAPGATYERYDDTDL